MSKLKPAWLVGDEDGFTVTLSRRATINGVQVGALSMRPPTLGDIRVAQRLGGKDDQKVEGFLFASLCGCGVDEFDGILYKDFRRLQLAYDRFLDDSENTGSATDLLRS